MEWTRHTSGSAFERDFSYSRALHDGEWVFVSGTTGFDYSTMTLSDDPAEQTRQTVRNVGAALEACGSSLAEVYGYLLVVADRASVPAVMDAFAGALPARPTGTLIVAGLIEERIKVELEVRARRGWTSEGD